MNSYTGQVKCKSWLEWDLNNSLPITLHDWTHLVHRKIREQYGGFPRNAKYQSSISFVLSMNDLHVIPHLEKLLQLRGGEIKWFLEA